VLITALVLGALLKPFVVLAKGGADHIRDAMKITLDANAKKDSPLWELTSYISQGMDYGKRKGGEGIADPGSAFLKTIRAEFEAEGYESLKGLGQHHYYGHWDFNGAIPKEMLLKVRELSAANKLPPDAEARFILRWRQFVYSRTLAVKQVFCLSGDGSDRVARSFASIVDDIHNLGDWAFDKDTAGLRNVDDIVNNYCKSSNRILGKHNNLIMTIKQEIKALPKLPPKEYADSVLKILESHSSEMSERLYRVFTRYGYKGEIMGIDYAAIIKETAALDTTKSVARAAKGTSETIADAFKRVFKTQAICKVAKVEGGTAAGKAVVERTVKKKGIQKVSTTRALLRKLYTKDGGERYVLTVHIPENVFNGVSAGIMTFVISEGVSAVGFAKGEMTEDAFVVETEKNLGAALVDGLAVYAVCSLGFGPAGLVAIAVGVGAYVIYDIAFQKLYDINKYKGLSLDDYLGIVPEGLRNRVGPFEYEGACKMLDYEGDAVGLDYEGANPGFDYTGDGCGIGEIPNMRKDDYGL